MQPEPALRWRREIEGESALPVAWLLEIGRSVADPAVRLALATAAIQAAVGCENIQVRRSSTGAPVTSNPALYVSMASRRGCLAIALARAAVGVDVEAVTPLDPLPLAVLHPEERDYVNRSGRFRWLTSVRDAPLSRFFALWTAKESYLKLAGLGFGHEDETVAVIPRDDIALVRWGSGVLTLRRETASLESNRVAFFATCLLM
jgi:hypothetical protein